MKHQIKTTIFLVILFFIIQIFGVYLSSTTMTFSTNDKGEKVIEYDELNSGFVREQMDVWQAIINILIGMFLGTIILIFLLKNKKTKMWKGWISVGIFLTMFITISELTNYYYGIFLSVFLTYMKIKRNNFLINSLTEILIYPSFAILFSDIINIKSALFLLFIISIYDYIAVFKSKHMVFMAKEITNNKLFMGIMMPTKISKKSFFDGSFFKKNANENTNVNANVKNENLELNNLSKVLNNNNNDDDNNNNNNDDDNNNLNNEIENKNKDDLGVAILGGGDIAFPLLFNVAILKTFGLFPAFLSSLIVSIGLFIFFMFTRKGKFYPAIPPLTISCVISLLIIWILF
ncbi:MAG: presenilin family intramembrane aspartyl protease [Candidatus Nanoarchaeia archaeon]|nr:presenilin family intramembrane aspartyl protease [Candidatus Nanoarchaeia archaeon]